MKKVMLEMSWWAAKEFNKLEAIEDKRTAFLIHAFPLVYLTMCGRMMQATSDDIRLTLLLEVSSIVTEVFEAKDL
jgi:hypothetical protein